MVPLADLIDWPRVHCRDHPHYISSYLTLAHNLNDMSEQAELTSARYGKTKVRVLRVVREDKWHHVVEYNVEALLEGDIATR